MKSVAEVGRLNEWGSHLPALLACVAATTGPVLELGIGHYSTPLLHAVCAHRSLVSIEDNAEWFDSFVDEFSSGWHTLMLKPYDSEVISDICCAVALLDQHPGSRRAKDALRLRDKAWYIVVHDYSAPDVSEPFASILEQWPYRFVHTRYYPHTLVLGMREIPVIP